jgi:transposase
MYLTFKAKITTDKGTEAILNNICFSATKLYNTVNWYLRSEWQHDKALCDYCDAIGYPHNGVKIPLNRTELQSMFKDNHWAKNLHSQSAQFIIGEVINAYKSWFAHRKNGNGNANPPSFRLKASLSPVTFVQSAQILFSKNGNTYLHFSLGTKREDGLREITVKIVHRKNLPEGVLKNVKITYDTVTGNYYAHLVFDVPVKRAVALPRLVKATQLQLFPTNVVSVDLGLNNIITATFSDGTSLIISGRELKAIRRYWQKVRTKVKPPSVEGVVLSRRRRRLDASAPDASPRANRKASRRYREICRTEQISERYTSQTCCRCGVIDKNNRKTRGLYICDCGNRINADRNGANNILRKYLRDRSSGSVALPVVTLVLQRTDGSLLRKLLNEVNILSTNL